MLPPLGTSTPASSRPAATHAGCAPHPRASPVELCPRPQQCPRPGRRSQGAQPALSSFPATEPSTRSVLSRPPPAGRRSQLLRFLPPFRARIPGSGAHRSAVTALRTRSSKGHRNGRPAGQHPVPPPSCPASPAHGAARCPGSRPGPLVTVHTLMLLPPRIQIRPLAHLPAPTLAQPLHPPDTPCLQDPHLGRPPPPSLSACTREAWVLSALPSQV